MGSKTPRDSDLIVSNSPKQGDEEVISVSESSFRQSEFEFLKAETVNFEKPRLAPVINSTRIIPKVLRQSPEKKELP